MPQRKVTFTTDADPKEIRKALLALPGHTYFEIDEPKQKAKMSDWKQIILIWGAAFIVAIVAFLYIEWGTRP